MKSRIFLGLFVLSLAFVWAANEGFALKDLKGKKIVMIIAHRDYRDEELTIPMKLFKEEGADVTIASSSTDVAKGVIGDVTVKPDMLYSDVNARDYDAVVFIGGPGASEYWQDSTAQGLANDTYSAGKILGAICLAPVTLANAGVLKGKKATVWPDERKQLINKGVKYVDSGVVVDGRIVTAAGPKRSRDFAKEIIKLLKQSVKK